MNRIAHQERKRIKAAAIPIKYKTIRWGIVIGTPVKPDHVTVHPLSRFQFGEGAMGSLKKVVNLDNIPGCSTPNTIG